MGIRHIPLMLALALALGWLAPAAKAEQPAADTKQVTATQQNNEQTVVKGKVLGVSQKAKTITIESKEGLVMIKFNDQTTGMEYAEKDAAAIVKFIQTGKEKMATVIKPKLAELPAGVVEMQPTELAELVAMGPVKANYFLIDSRPAGPYAAAHIPTAVSIPVETLKKEGATALLPADKTDIQLIFYCGGTT
ncbi:MAG: rhodanese-like domain-containing protein [Proteobacteria bacterium]|nr:rhodanese-like domain-containing protein [Pseudomonadota bacterium]MBU1714487.1 rhodanese-like domain-containing protein [Pseudomonadota bacterium]